MGKILAPTAALLATLAAPALAYADEPGDLQGLLDTPVVVSASKSAESGATAPATTTIITAEELWSYGIRSLDEGLNFLVLGMVATNPLHSSEVGARGVLLSSDFGNHVLVLIDGHAVNEQWDGTAYYERGLAIPMEMVDHIEVILGPGSVLYGSNAMLGVIHVFTKRAKDFQGGRAVLDSELATSFRTGLGYGTEGTLFGKRAELTVMAESCWQSGPAFTFGPQLYGNDAITGAPKDFGPRSAAGIWGGRASHSYSTRVPALYARGMLGEFELSLRFAAYERRTPYVNDFNQTVTAFDEPASRELDRWATLDLKHHRQLTSRASLRSRAYGDAYDFQQHLLSYAAEDCGTGQLSGCRRYILGYSQWAGLEEQLTLDWTMDGRYATLIGIDGRIRHIGHRMQSDDRLSGARQTYGDSSGTEKLLALYIQQTARPIPQIGLNAGVRLDLDERFGSALSPRVAGTYSPWKNGVLKVVYAEAFRAPTYYELYYVDPSLQIAAPDLGPERVRSIEGSVEQRLGAQRVMGGVFRSFWRDLVALDPLTPGEINGAVAAGRLYPGTTEAYQYRNVSTIDNWGLHAVFEGSLLERRLRYGMNVTVAWTDRRAADGSEMLVTVTPKAFGNARVSYELGHGFPTLALAGYLWGRAPADRANDGGFTPTPYAPAQLVLRATATGPVPKVPGLSYRVGATWAASGHSAYVVGPNQATTPDQPQAQLAPVDRFRVAAGVLYEFGR